MKPWVPPGAINGTYLIAPAGGGWGITVTRSDGLIEPTLPAATLAEAVRLARPLSDHGLTGFIKEIPSWTSIGQRTSPSTGQTTYRSSPA